MSFEEFNLDSRVLQGIADINYKQPTPIQSACIQKIMDGKDLVASAETGTGKTGAFVIPILSKYASNPAKGIKALILTPTRELAAQIDEQVDALGYHTDVTSVTVYGGGGSGDWSRQEKALYDQKVNIVVATPGRLMDHMKMRKIDFEGLEFFILDEADRMLDMGFLPDVKSIEARLPKQRQNLLFSATMPRDIEIFANAVTKNPERVNIASQKPAKGIKQISYKVQQNEKDALLLYLIKQPDFNNAIVFVGTKRGADKLTSTLSRKGINVVKLHGDRSQREREDALLHFRSGKSNVIVATDVLSRGIDIKDISHIINYDVPNDIDDYIHRIGRTARAEATGEAVTIVTPGREQHKMNAILEKMGSEIEFGTIPGEIKSNGSRSQDSRGHNGKGRGHSNQSSGQHSGNQRNNKSKNGDQKKSHDSSHQHNKPWQQTEKKYNRNRPKNSGQKHDERRHEHSFRKEDQEAEISHMSLKERQRKALRDAKATKQALMNNRLEPGPGEKKGNGIKGIFKKLFGK